MIASILREGRISSPVALIMFVTLVAGSDRTSWGAPPVVGDRLPPPQQVEALPLAKSAGPAARTAPKAESTPSQLWSLPIPEIVRTPVKTSVEVVRPTWLHPARDVPVIASEVQPNVPTTPRLSEAPRSFVASRNPHVAPALAAFPRDIERAPAANVNPTDAASFTFLVQAVPAPAAKPAPPLNLSIPDPDAALRAVQVPNTVPPTSGDPSVSRESPARPMLPVSGDVKK